MKPRLFPSKLFSLFAALLFLCAPGFGQAVKKAALKPSPNSKPFGLQIGGAFTLPECEHHMSPKAAYSPGQTRWCWVDPTFIPKAEPTDFTTGKHDVMVRFPAAETPQITVSPALDATVENGKLQTLSFRTNGVRGVQDTMERLTTMFGKPLTEVPIKVENNVGDEFESKNATWQFSDMVVNYQGVMEDLSLGTVWMETPQAYKERMAQPKKKENPLK